LTIDRKVTVWTREHHTVKAKTREEAAKFLVDGLHADMDTFLLESSNERFEYLSDSETPMTIQENGNASTIEITDFKKPEDGIWNNRDGFEPLMYENDEVFWTDPDNGIGSGIYKIQKITGSGPDTVYRLSNSRGAKVEAYRHELS